MTKVDPKAPVTYQLLNDAVDTIVGAMDEMRQEMNQRFDEVERRVDRAPSRMEFDRLSQRVEQLEKLLHASS